MKRLKWMGLAQAKLCGLLSLALLAASPHVRGQALKGVSDPTRPPPGAVRQLDAGATPGQGQAMSVGSAAAAASAASAASPAEPPLPSVSLNAIRYDTASATGVALINGSLVRVGDKVAGRTVVAVQRDAVVLRGPGKGAGGEQRLSLLPASETNETTRPNSARAAARGRKERK